MQQIRLLLYSSWLCSCCLSFSEDAITTRKIRELQTVPSRSISMQKKMGLTKGSEQETGKADEEDNQVQQCDVVVVGAGATGLSCAHDLLHHQSGVGEKELSVVVLEARNRFGGRIYSSPEERTHVDGKTKVSFVMDHGAAWVHGTGFDWPKEMTTEEKKSEVPLSYDNPMMTLLQKITRSDQDLCQTHLNPVFPVGNPWIRPQAAVHAHENMVLYVDGKRIPTSCFAIDQAVKRHFSIMQNVSRVGQDMYNAGNGMDTAKVSLEQTVQKVLSSPEYAAKTLKNGESDSDPLIERIVPFYRYMIECWYACPASSLPLSTFVASDSETDDEQSGCSDWDAEYFSDGDFYGPHCTVPNGMTTLLEPLVSEKVRECIHFNQEVVAIRDEGDSVFVETRTGFRVRANVCVVTMSVGCLQHAIKESSLFEPPLSSCIQEAVFSRSMGGYKKVFLTFDRIFWPINEPLIGLIRRTKENSHSSGIGDYLLLDNLWAKDGIPCLEAILIGSAATEFSHKTDDEIKRAVLKFLEDAMGEEHLHEYCVGCHVTRWEEDPFSLGAYSSYKIGTMERQAQEITKPEWNRKLMLAGEACNPEHEGSFHGALFSGLETAEKIRNFLNTL